MPGAAERLHHPDHGAAIGLGAETFDDDLRVGLEADARSFEVRDLGGGPAFGADRVAGSDHVTFICLIELRTVVAQKDGTSDEGQRGPRDIGVGLRRKHRTRAERESERDDEDDRREGARM